MALSLVEQWLSSDLDHGLHGLTPMNREGGYGA
jgi:hypothetical protein